MHSLPAYMHDLPLHGRAYSSLAGKPCLLLKFVHFFPSSPRESCCFLLLLLLLHLTKGAVEALLC